MSDRASRFLIHWLTRHVEALPAMQRLASAVRLASLCRKDAVAAGIPSQEIRAAAGGELIRKIFEALDVVARLRANDAPLAAKTGAENSRPPSRSAVRETQWLPRVRFHSPAGPRDVVSRPLPERRRPR